MNIIKKIAKRFFNSRTGNTDAKTELENLRKLIGIFPPGHFYSPIPDLEEVRRAEHIIWGPPSREVEGVDLNIGMQEKLLKEFSAFYKEMPFSEKKKDGLRYYFENPAFSYTDAIILYSMIRHAKPRHIIEVGSGFSSCVMLDTNDIFFGGEIKTTFIEPCPDLLHSLLKEGDRGKARILPMRLQDTPLSEFDDLQNNDILFIDSTHVSKVNSDVNHIFFKILPRLQSGVIIHFHDIFPGFEYPKSWVFEGRAWNEAYMLRAFLQYNHAFKVLFFNAYMCAFYEEYIRQHMPLCLKNVGGSLWLQKL
jgi:predicted O-methyltransferase YrrM